MVSPQPSPLLTALTHPEWITAFNTRLASLSPSVLALWSSLLIHHHPPRSVTLECARSLYKPFVFSICISSLVTAPSLVALPPPRNNPQRRQWQSTPVLLPGKSHGQRSLVGCSPWGREESETTEWLHFHFSLSCIGEGSGNPLQCSCLENPRDGGAWWAAVYGVTQSRTRVKWLGSSSRNNPGIQTSPLN